MRLSKKISILLILLAAILIAASLFLFPGKLISPIVSQIEEFKNIKILFVGDAMFDRGVRYYAQKNGGNDFIFEKIHSELLKYDLVVVNLEGPITDEKSISAGTAPGSTANYFFTFDPSWAKTLFKNNIKIVNLGNNHILNFHTAGLKSTEKYLSEAKIDYFGSPDGNRGVIKEIGGVKIAFINYNEFYGDLEIERTAVIEEIKRLKTMADIVITFSHWGAEYAGPDQAMRSLARQFIDNGADLVIGSHSHIIGPMEAYNGKRIYYSLGNFIFDQYFSEEVRNGLGVVLKINPKTKELNFEEKNFYLGPNGQTILVEKTNKK